MAERARLLAQTHSDSPMHLRSVQAPSEGYRCDASLRIKDPQKNRIWYPGAEVEENTGATGKSESGGRCRVSLWQRPGNIEGGGRSMAWISAVMRRVSKIFMRMV